MSVYCKNYNHVHAQAVVTRLSSLSRKPGYKASRYYNIESKQVRMWSIYIALSLTIIGVIRFIDSCIAKVEQNILTEVRCVVYFIRMSCIELST